MALKQSLSTHQSSNQAGATGVLSSPSNTLRHATLNASIKIAGVILFVVMCALIVMSSQASGKQASNLFNQANKDSATSLGLDPSNQGTQGASATNESGTQTGSDTSSSGGTSMSANVSNGSVSVTVDGNSVTVPAGSSYSKTVTNADGNLNVSVNTNSTGSANNSSFTSTNTTLMSNSSSFSSNNGSFSSGGSYFYSY